jgi:hypothetical protein
MTRKEREHVDLGHYLDGLSGHLHGRRETAEQDQRIRTRLRNNGYEVIEIAVSTSPIQARNDPPFSAACGISSGGTVTVTHWLGNTRAI